MMSDHSSDDLYFENASEPRRIPSIPRILVTDSKLGECGSHGRLGYFIITLLLRSYYVISMLFYRLIRIRNDKLGIVITIELNATKKRPLFQEIGICYLDKVLYRPINDKNL